MPRAALISFCNRTGHLKVLCSVNLEPDGSLPTEGPLDTGRAYEQLFPATQAGVEDLARFLKRLAPIMPDGTYRPGPTPDPAAHPGQHITRYTQPAGARGSGRTGPRQATYTQLMQIAQGLSVPKAPEPTEETSESDDTDVS